MSFVPSDAKGTFRQSHFCIISFHPMEYPVFRTLEARLTCPSHSPSIVSLCRTLAG